MEQASEACVLHSLLLMLTSRLGWHQWLRSSWRELEEQGRAQFPCLVCLQRVATSSSPVCFHPAAWEGTGGSAGSLALAGRESGKRRTPVSCRVCPWASAPLPTLSPQPRPQAPLGVHTVCLCRRCPLTPPPEQPSRPGCASDPEKLQGIQHQALLLPGVCRPCSLLSQHPCYGQTLALQGVWGALPRCLQPHPAYTGCVVMVPQAVSLARPQAWKALGTGMLVLCWMGNVPCCVFWLRAGQFCFSSLLMVLSPGPGFCAGWTIHGQG